MLGNLGAPSLLKIFLHYRYVCGLAWLTGVLYFSRVVTHFIVHVLSELVLFSVQCSSQAALAI